MGQGFNAIYLFYHQRAPHGEAVAGIGADVFVFSGAGGSLEIQLVGVAGEDQRSMGDQP